MMEIPAEEIKIEVWPIEGVDRRGGQHVGGNSGVRVTHLPSGVMAYVKTRNSQHHNREIAMDMILAAITHPKF